MQAITAAMMAMTIQNIELLLGEEIGDFGAARSAAPQR
jgi:hypothetical protein